MCSFTPPHTTGSSDPSAHKVKLLNKERNAGLLDCRIWTRDLSLAVRSDGVSLTPIHRHRKRVQSSSWLLLDTERWRRTVDPSQDRQGRTVLLDHPKWEAGNAALLQELVRVAASLLSFKLKLPAPGTAPLQSGNMMGDTLRLFTRSRCAFQCVSVCCPRKSTSVYLLGSFAALNIGALHLICVVWTASLCTAPHTPKRNWVRSRSPAFNG
ncbi:hypothetical protein F5884DRAFT_257339 [Xylogone sp. PMI_703]|nr:hypothetical protein F5884DRAFT_257339 [Xylogone sp. PMI_703]